MAYTVITKSPEDTYTLGKILGGLLGSGDVVCLNGELGAGKTRMAQGIAAGLGIQEPVTSPTFTLINEYQGRLPLFHMDVYRLGGSEEMADLGCEEYFYGQGVTLVEWAGLVEDVLPEERLDIFIAYSGGGENSREIKFIPVGGKYELLVEELTGIVCAGN